MRKHLIALAALAIATIGTATAQFNIQEMYDFGRKHLTTTIEGFKADKWGTTFFFNDIYHPTSFSWPTGYYTEVSRTLNFWQQSKLGALSAHVEWNGGQYANNAWLVGAEYMLHSADFANTFTFALMYKAISGQTDNVPLQFTFVWGMRNLIGVEGLAFSGFIDVWGEVFDWNSNPLATPDKTHIVMLAEPQLWYTIGQHFGCPNLCVGGEVEVAYNFTGGYHTGSEFGNNKGLTVAPCLGIKWVF